jgi:hypothetical protein
MMILSHARHLTILALALLSPRSVRACEIGTGLAFCKRERERSFVFWTAWPSFRGDAEHRTRNLEIPGLVLTHHPGMTREENS